MSSLWTQAMAHQAMPWQVHPGEEDYADHAKHVKDVGFAGFVQHPSYERLQGRQEPPFNHDKWNELEPEPEDHDWHHFDEHGEFSPSHSERHQKAYDDWSKGEAARDVPDHTSHHLHVFQRSDGLFPDTWEKHGEFKPVGIKGPVWATQSHVNQGHINRYKNDPGDKSWFEHRGGDPMKAGVEYKGTKHPLFVTHQGRLHVIEGHHRVAAAMQRGDTHIQGWHINLDEYHKATGQA